MRILGVDAATAKFGYGLLDDGAYVAAGVLTAPSGRPLNERLMTLGTEYRALLVEYRPDAVALESPFVQYRNAAFPLGAIRGIVLWISFEERVQVVDYAPSEIRKLIGVGGQAKKKVIPEFVRKALKMRKAPDGDAADALAVALAHSLVGKS